MRGDLVASISATGTIEPMEAVDVGAQVGGRIDLFGNGTDGKIIDYGSVVQEGELLAKIDDSVYSAELNVSKAQLEQDKAAVLSANANVDQMSAKLAQAEAEWKRAQALNESKLLAQTDFDTAEANYRISKANLAVAEASVAQAKAGTVQALAAVEKAQRNLDFCTIKSPVTGVIIDRRVNIGQTVVSSFNAPSLFLIARDLTRMQIWVSVNEADIGRILPGTPVVFSCDAFRGKEFTGSVGKVRLNATMTQNVVMYTVEVNTENPDKILLPYLTANVHFMVQKSTNVLMVPNAALRWTPSSTNLISDTATGRGGATDEKMNTGRGGRTGTLWLRDGEHVAPLQVKVGVSDGVNTEVTSENLHEGEEIVTGETSGKAQINQQNPFLPPVIKR